MPRFNAYVLNPSSADGAAEEGPAQVPITGAASAATEQAVWRSLAYLHSSGTEEDVKAITHWVVGDFTSEVSIDGYRC